MNKKTGYSQSSSTHSKAPHLSRFNVFANKPKMTNFLFWFHGTQKSENEIIKHLTRRTKNMNFIHNVFWICKFTWHVAKNKEHTLFHIYSYLNILFTIKITLNFKKKKMKLKSSYFTDSSWIRVKYEKNFKSKQNSYFCIIPPISVLFCCCCCLKFFSQD